jgi:hypothetical protein
MVAFIFSKEKKKKTFIAIPELGTNNEVEVLLDETHSFSAETTDSPVEEGADITDHIHVKPLTYKMRGVYSNAPIEEIEVTSDELPELGSGVLGFIGVITEAQVKKFRRDYKTVLSSKTSGQVGRLGDIIAFYRSLIESKQLVTIETRSDVYTDLVCTNFSYQRNKESGANLFVEASFKKVRIVSTDSIAIEESDDQKIGSDQKAQNPTAENKSKGKKVPNTEPENSGGSVLYNSIFGG